MPQTEYSAHFIFACSFHLMYEAKAKLYGKLILDRHIKYAGVWGKSNFSCTPSLKAADWGPAEAQLWSLGWSWHYKPALCQATFYDHSAFPPPWIYRFFQMLSTGSSDLSGMRLENFKYKECLGSAAVWAANLLYILLFETLLTNQSHKVTDWYILL